MSFAGYNVVDDSSVSQEQILTQIHNQFYHGKGCNTSVGLKHRKEISFDITRFEEVFDFLSRQSWLTSVTARDFHRIPKNGDQVPLLLRHDIDGDIDSAVHLARLQAKYGLKGTYFILPAAIYYSDWYLKKGKDEERPFVVDQIKRFPAMVPLYREIQELGHEIGLHYFPYGAYVEKNMDGIQHIQEELRWLRGHGLEIYGGVGHSSHAATGADMAEIFKEHANPEINVTAGPARIALQGDVEFKGVRLPRRFIDVDAIDLDYIHEFNPIGNGYWAFHGNSRVFYSGTEIEPSSRSDNTTISEMLSHIENRTNPNGYALNSVCLMIHPVHARCRVSMVRGDEDRITDEGAKNFLDNIDLAPENRISSCLMTNENFESEKPYLKTKIFTNRFGYLDYEPEFTSEFPLTVIGVGGSFFEAPHLSIACNLFGSIKRTFLFEEKQHVHTINLSAANNPTSSILPVLEEIPHIARLVLVMDNEQTSKENFNSVRQILSDKADECIIINLCRSGQDNFRPLCSEQFDRFITIDLEDKTYGETEFLYLSRKIKDSIYE